MQTIFLCFTGKDASSVQVSSMSKDVLTRMSGLLSDYSFALTFPKASEFMWCLDFCGNYVLDITDSVIGQERALVFFDATAFLLVMNEILKRKFHAKLHIINNTAP